MRYIIRICHTQALNTRAIEGINGLRCESESFQVARSQFMNPHLVKLLFYGHYSDLRNTFSPENDVSRFCIEYFYSRCKKKSQLQTSSSQTLWVKISNSKTRKQLIILIFAQVRSCNSRNFQGKIESHHES